VGENAARGDPRAVRRRRSGLGQPCLCRGRRERHARPSSGVENPTTLNFLPETHIVVLAGKDLVGDYEAAWAKLRGPYGKGVLPRTVNMITGPSRSADIEQTLLLGAHGPRKLHVIVVGNP